MLDLFHWHLMAVTRH